MVSIGEQERLRAEAPKLQSQYEAYSARQAAKGLSVSAALEASHRSVMSKALSLQRTHEAIGGRPFPTKEQLIMQRAEALIEGRIIEPPKEKVEVKEVKASLYKRTLEKLKGIIKYGEARLPPTPYEKKVAVEEVKIEGLGKELSEMIEGLTTMEGKIKTEADYNKYLAQFKSYEEKSTEYKTTLERAGYVTKDGTYVKEPVTLKTFEERVGRKPTSREWIDFKYAEAGKKYITPAYTYLAEKEEKILEKIGLAKVIPFIRPIRKALVEPKVEFSVTNFAQFLAFSPLMRTAAASKQVAKKVVKDATKSVKKVVAKKPISKLDVKNIVAITKKDPILQRKQLMKAIENWKASTANPIQKRKALIELRKIYDEILGKATSEMLWKDVLEQKGLLVERQVITGKGWIELIKPEIPVERLAPIIARPKIIPKPKVKPKYKDVFKIKPPKVKVIPKEKVVGAALREIQAARQRAAQAAAQAVKQREELAQEVMAATMLRQKTAAAQAQKTKAAQKVAVATMLGVTTAQKSALRQQMRYKLKLRPRLRIRLKVKPLIAPAIFPPIPKKAIAKLLKVKKPKPLVPKEVGYIAYVKRRGLWKTISPVVKRKEAIWFGAKRARETLAAAFKIGKVAKPITVKRYPTLARPSPEVFRPYKIVKGERIPLKNHFIQRREFRLAAPTEVKEIQAARRSMDLKVPKSKSKIRW